VPQVLAALRHAKDLSTSRGRTSRARRVSRPRPGDIFRSMTSTSFEGGLTMPPKTRKSKKRAMLVADQRVVFGQACEPPPISCRVRILAYRDAASQVGATRSSPLLDAVFMPTRLGGDFSRKSGDQCGGRRPPEWTRGHLFKPELTCAVPPFRLATSLARWCRRPQGANPVAPIQGQEAMNRAMRCEL